MTNLKDVLEFIAKADTGELEIIREAFNGMKLDKSSNMRASLKVGDNVYINHRKIDAKRMFFVFKINGVNIKVKEVGKENVSFNVTPSLLVKI
tara:strand:- start:310 stop:588 length:279 start_codon:yes stop_codon:yes gene_type:complete